MGVIDWIKDYLSDIKKSTGKTFRNIVFTSHFWVILIAVALIISMSVMIFNYLQARKDQDLAAYWGDGSETSYRQMSVFAKADNRGRTLPPYSLLDDSGLTLDKITGEEGLRDSLQGTVNAGKKMATDTKKGLVGWEDCYSSSFNSTANYSKTAMVNGAEKISVSSADVEVVAVGGNFAAFHPFEYMDGGFLPVKSANDNLIVIDDNLAWRFFRSYSVSGQKITLWDQDFTICGVVREKKDDTDKTSGASKDRVFVYFSKIDSLNKKGVFIPTEQGEGELAITCYEAFLPEVVSGVAKTDMISALPSYNMSDPQMRVVSNTGRFRVDRIWEHNMPIGHFEAETRDYDFPYWERAAILTTERLFVCEAVLLFGVILLFIGIIILILRKKKKEPEALEELPEEVTDDTIVVFR